MSWSAVSFLGDDFVSTTESSSSSSLSIEKTSNPRSKEKFSIFGDVSCGEPLFAQRLLIDFTPDEIVDNDFVQKKICSFWEFIENTPVIQNLVVTPERNTYSKEPTTTNVEETKSESNYSSIVIDPTAVSMMEFVEEKRLIDRAFEAKIPQSQCTLGSREYKENEPVVHHRKKKTCTCTTICSTCLGFVKKPLQPSHEYLTPVKRLCKKMKEWDVKHPKSMDPPGHAPSLQHYTMHRQVYE